jgi:hypothetical protein
MKLLRQPRSTLFEFYILALLIVLSTVDSFIALFEFPVCDILLHLDPCAAGNMN